VVLDTERMIKQTVGHSGFLSSLCLQIKKRKPDCSFYFNEMISLIPYEQKK